MAKKLVGRNGRELLSVPVTEGDGRTLPKPRQTAKLKSALRIFGRCVLVDFNTTNVSFGSVTNIEVYNVLNGFGYHWDGEHWSRHYPDWVKVEI